MRQRGGLTLLELMVVVAIVAVLSMSATYVLLDAAKRAKESAVKANVSAAYSSIIYSLATDYPSESLLEEIINTLNNPDTQPNTGDELFSPFDKTATAFTQNSAVKPGQVSIAILDDDSVKIIGYGEDTEKPLISKTAIAFAE